MSKRQLSNSRDDSPSPIRDWSPEPSSSSNDSYNLTSSSPELSTSSNDSTVAKTLDRETANKIRAAREENNEDRKAKAMENVKTLLNMSEKYSNLWQSRLHLLNSKKTPSKERANVMNDKEVVDLNKAKYFKGTLRPYQIEGVNWMRTLFMGGISGILADEMGLGKTVQVIALLAHLIEKGVYGPHLIIVPLSTLANWNAEFKRFAPDMPVIVFHGTKEERRALQKDVQIKKRVNSIRLYPTLLLSYQTVLSEAEFLRNFTWKYVVIDEAHRIKNHKTQLAVAVRKLKTENKLLLTGTPLQNNMTELWALLNFVMPQIFNNIDIFSTIFMLEDFEDEKLLNEHKENNVIVTAIHKILAPFMMRRLKVDVLDDIVPKEERLVQCPMSEQQLDLYTHVIKKTIESLLHKGKDREVDITAPRVKRRCYKENYSNFDKLAESDNFEDAVDIIREENYFTPEAVTSQTNEFKHYFTMQNPLSMFRKIVDHPYLVSMPLVPGKKEILVDENIIFQSGKMMVLHAMLRRLKQQKHKVLIFSTLSMMLDVIEEYLIMEEYNYGRLDGSMSYKARQENINSFNNDPDVFVFLITTRAGGLGINLTAADTVIFFDRDWNPQADKQAQARCHRIGQTKPVMIYTLVAKNTIDERVLSCGEMKQRLEKLVIKETIGHQTDYAKMDQYREILKIIEDNMLDTMILPNGIVFTDEELDKLLDRSAIYHEWEAQKKKGGVK